MLSIGPGELYSLGCAVAWAAAVILFRKAGEQLPPLALNLTKNALVLPLFLLTILLVEGAMDPAIPAPHLLLVLASGVLGIAAGDTAYLRALQHLGTGRIAAVQTLYSPFVIGLSLAFLGERLNLWQFGGVALVLLGILMVGYGGGRGGEPRQLMAGVGWGVVSVFLMALGVVLAKPMLEQYSFLWVVTLRIAGGLLGLVAVTALTTPLGDLRRRYAAVRNWPVVLAAGLTGSYLSMMLWMAGYKYTDASIAAVLNELAAVFILIFAWLFLREPANRRQWLGTLLAVAGAVLVVLR